jgi:hypothetical protein
LVYAEKLASPANGDSLSSKRDAEQRMAMSSPDRSAVLVELAAGLRHRPIRLLDGLQLTASVRRRSTVFAAVG